MKMLDFLDRSRELSRLRRFFGGRSGFAVVFGRRRLGKSRLLTEAIGDLPHIYYVADARDAALQLRSVAEAVDRVLPGFAEVDYPDFDALTRRLWKEAPRPLVFAIDELPELVARIPEVPSVLQKRIDAGGGPHLIVAGSSQRMMRGLVMDGSAPLFGRATEVMELQPIPAGWLGEALHLRSPAAIVEQHAAWGGVPRYWELAARFDGLSAALGALMLDPLGPLHHEPERLLLDDVSDVTRPASILALVGRGCHRLSEIAGRLRLRATDLSRPLAQLVDLGLLARELPFGESTRSSKRSVYRITDPFLRTWYRFVEPNRSRLGAGLLEAVSGEVEHAWPDHVGHHWEALAREAVPHLEIAGRRWGMAGRWWGRAGGAAEIDLVAESLDGERLLFAEAKRTCSAREARNELAALERKAAASSLPKGRPYDVALFVLRSMGKAGDPRILRARDIVQALR